MAIEVTTIAPIRAIAAAVGADATARRSIVPHVLNVMDGATPAIGDGVTDDTAALQAAITAGGIIFLPAGTYLITSTLTITVPVHIFGEGVNSVISLSGAAGATVDAIKFLPALASSSETMMRLEYFQVKSATGLSGRHAIHFDLTAAIAAITNCVIDHVYIGAMGGKGIQLTNPTNNDAFVLNVITGCQIYGGVYLQRCGDSVTIEQNQITGANTGIDVSMVAGAAQLVIRENNITSAGGGIVIHSGTQVKIQNNQIEQLAAYTGTDAGCVVIKGDTAEVSSAEIEGNNINTLGDVTNCIDVQNATTTHIGSGNALNCQISNAGQHVKVGASADRTYIQRANDFQLDYVPGPARVTVDAAATRTYGPKFAPTLLNSWVAFDAVNHPVLFTRDPVSGIVSLEGAVMNGTLAAFTPIFTLPVGFRPTQGAEYFTVTANNAGAWTTATILIDGAGSVQVITGFAAFMGFDNVRFQVEL